MAAFLEERISVEIRYDNTYQDDYAVEITQSGGSDDTKASEYRRLVHPFPVRRFSIPYQLDKSVLNDQILGVYNRSYGKFSGFRAKHFDDYTTNNFTSAPTSFDEPLARVGTGIYQLQKRYGIDKTPLSIGHPVRTIFKPVAGTVLVAVNGVQQLTGWTVNTTNGRITFTVDPGIAATVTGGCQFDIPVRFDAPIPVQQNHKTSRYVTVELVELLNP